jgi:hypothetical protein
MDHKTFKFVAIILLLLCVSATIDPVAAQCAMCKASAEANLKTGGGDPRGLNFGILYMLILPYALVGSIGVWWWRNRRNEIQQVVELTDEEMG